MHSFKDLVTKFADHFAVRHFPQQPASLYEPNEYFLSWGGKRIRPVMCLMGNELFDEIHPDSFELATAIELFHNFTLIHDDIMDEAPLRRGMETVHMKYGLSTALLAGDHLGVWSDSWRNRYPTRNDGLAIGVDGVLGVDYKIKGAPLNLSFDWQPSFNFIGYNYFEGGWGGIGIRYTF